MVWEVRSTASGNAVNNGGGGGFKPGATGTDWSQQNDCQYHLTGVTTAAANAILLHASAAADMVGNIAHLISGTNATVGWYEIISVSPGVSITLDATCCSAALASGVVNIGGCISLNSATANQTDTNWAAALIAGNTVYVNGSLTIAATFSPTAGAAGTPVQFIGYNTTRTDAPTGASRPTINCATFTATAGGVNQYSNIIFTGTAANMFTISSAAILNNCKFINTSTTAARNALNWASANVTIRNCEFVSYRGNAINLGSGGSGVVWACYIHDSDIGITSNTSSAWVLKNCILASNVTNAMTFTNSGAVIMFIEGNTFYGAENKLGVGVAITSALTGFRIYNNIFYGFTTAINDSNVAGNNFEDYNCFNTNTTARTNISVGTHSVTTAPAFTSVAQVTGTAGTVSSSTITDGAASFANVVDNQDYCYIISGTGATAGQYKITSHTATSITLDIAPGGSGTNIVYQVTTGRNFAVGTNLKQIGFPGALPAGLTTSYVDIGVAQRSELSVDPGVANVRLGTGYTISQAVLSGTLDLPAVSTVQQGIQFDNTTKTGTYSPSGGASRLGNAKLG